MLWKRIRFGHLAIHSLRTPLSSPRWHEWRSGRGGELSRRELFSQPGGKRSQAGACDTATLPRGAGIVRERFDSRQVGRAAQPCGDGTALLEEFTHGVQRGPPGPCAIVDELRAD